MTHRGALDGTGRLLAGSADLGSARYHIDVYAAGSRFGIQPVRGTVAASPGALVEAFNATACRLALQGGGTVDIAITRLRGGEADIEISGPVPGF